MRVLQLARDGGERQDVKVIIRSLVREKFLVALTDEIIVVLESQQVGGKCRLGVVAQDAGLETVVCGLCVPIAMIASNDYKPVHVFHKDTSKYL